ncbi:MAG: transposase, partial [Bacteroidales bacterium]|nr:transposase [Bacteroidales bacterium]
MVLPVRKSPRAKWHNYNGADYFVTICTGDRINYFGSIVDGKTQLTAVGEYTKQCIEKIGVIYKNVQVPLYVIMPNHIH